MILENRFTTAKIRMFFIISLFVAVCAGIFSYITTSFLERYLTLGVSIFAFLFYIFLHLTKPYFVFFSDEKGKITLRFYYAHPFLHKYRSFEFAKESLHNFEIKTLFFGQRKTLTLFQKRGREILRYPDLEIGLFTQKQVQALELVLFNILKSNKL